MLHHVVTLASVDGSATVLGNALVTSAYSIAGRGTCVVVGSATQGSWYPWSAFQPKVGVDGLYWPILIINYRAKVEYRKE